MRHLLIFLLPILLNALAAADRFEVSGTVLDDAGEPVAEARAFLLHEQEVYTAPVTAGRFHFGELDTGFVHLVVLHDTLAMAGYSGFLGAPLDVTLRCDPAGSIHLRVFGAGSGPIAGARVSALVVGGNFLVPLEAFAEAGFPMWRSDDEGKLEASLLPRGDHVRLTVRHFDYADTVLDFLPVREAPQQIMMHPGTPVAGRITQEGADAEGALVSVLQSREGDVREVAQERTDKEGFFHLRLRPGEYRVLATTNTHGTAQPGVLLVGEGGEEAQVTVDLAALRSISGDILYPDGRPCAGAQLLFELHEVPLSSTYTDATGDFQLRTAAASGILRVITPPGFMMKELPVIKVDLGEERQAKLDTIRLEEIPRQQGVIVDDAGALVAQALLVSQNLQVPVYAVTDAEGRFDVRIFEETEEDAVHWRVEHPQRFQRADLQIPLKATGIGRHALAVYEPDVSQPPPSPRGNNLEALLGEAAPAWTVQRWFNSDDISLESLRGKAVLLFFFGGFDETPSGRDALEFVRALHAAVRGVDDIAIIGFHDATSTPEEVEEYLQLLKIGFPVALDGGRSETFDRYKVGHIPQTVLLDKAGKVRYYQVEGRQLELLKALRREGP